MPQTVRFEGIVRPFQSRDISPPAVPEIVPADILGTPKTVKFDWGKQAATAAIAQPLTWTFSHNVTLYMTKQQREKEFNPAFPGG